LGTIQYILNSYPGILFRLDMPLAYHPAHRRNDVKNRLFMLIILFCLKCIN